MTFVDHDLRKYPYLEMDKYMVSIKDTKDGPTCLDLMEWEKGLEKVGLMSLVYILHFGHSMEVNECVKKLLVSFHSVFLWLNLKVSIDVELIAAITGLPLPDLDPTPFLTRKEKDIALMNKLKEKYDLNRDTRGFLISSMNDHIVRFTTKVLDIEFVPNIRPNQCTVGMIVDEKLCASDVQLNSKQYILNELLEYE